MGPTIQSGRAVPHDDMVWVPGGMFRLGSDGHYPEEAPVHSVSVDGFWIDRTPVTNRKFREFVRATGYITLNGAIERIVGLLCNIRGRSDIFPHLHSNPFGGRQESTMEGRA